MFGLLPLRRLRALRRDHGPREGLRPGDGHRGRGLGSPSADAQQEFAATGPGKRPGAERREERGEGPELRRSIPPKATYPRERERERGETASFSTPSGVMGGTAKKQWCFFSGWGRNVRTQLCAIGRAGACNRMHQDDVSRCQFTNRCHSAFLFL